MAAATLEALAERVNSLEARVAQLDEHSTRLDEHDRDLLELKVQGKNTALRLAALERQQEKLLEGQANANSALGVLGADLHKIFNLLTPIVLRAEKAERTMESVDGYLSRILAEMKR